METLNVGSLTLDKFVLGAGRLGDRTREKDCFEILDAYLDLGYHTLDVARSYAGGVCEEMMGEYLKKRKNRSKTVLISKGGFPLSRDAMHLTRLSKADLEADVNASLRALETDVIDLYFLHRDDLKQSPAELIENANRFISEGKVREIGASNWTCGRIKEANEYALAHGLKPFVSSQINYSLAQTTPALTGDLTHVVMNDVEYRWYASSHLPLIAYSVQAKGFFSKRLSGLPLKESGRKSYLSLPENYARAERLTRLSQQKNIPIPALLIAYVLSKEPSFGAIGGFSTKDQLLESEPGARLRLSPAEIGFLENDHYTNGECL